MLSQVRFPAPLPGFQGRTPDPKADTISPPVPELLMRSQKTANNKKGLARRLPIYTFALGLTLGVGVAGPLSSQLAGMVAGLIHAPDGLAAMVEPIGIGKRLILVMGTDEVGDNTDVMFTVQLDGDTTRVTQVPRDTYIETTEYGVLKANALYGLAGPEMAKSEVSRLLSVPVERHLKVNLDAVTRLADALGGVEVDVPKRMYYIDNSQGLYIDLYPGLQVLKGEELEGFLRYRNDELGDLGRMDRQKLVLREVFRQLARPGMLARLPALLKIAAEDIQTDLSPIELTQLARAMAQTRLSTSRLPGTLYWHNDLSYWLPSDNHRKASDNEDSEWGAPDAEHDQPTALTPAEATPDHRQLETGRVSSLEDNSYEDNSYEATSYQDERYEDDLYIEAAPQFETERSARNSFRPSYSSDQRLEDPI